MSGIIVPDRDEHGNFQTIIKVQEESRDPNKQTGHNYQAASWDFDITHAQGTWDYKDFLYPFPIALFSAEWINESTYDGDCFRVEIGPDTIVGALTADTIIGATVLPVSQTVIDNVKVGYQIDILEGATAQDLGRCIEVDPDNSTITVETACLDAHAAATPTYILMTVQMTRNLRLSGTSRVELGKDVIGGSFIPPNTPIRVWYQNNEGTTSGKTFSVVTEYKY